MYNSHVALKVLIGGLGILQGIVLITYGAYLIHTYNLDTESEDRSLEPLVGGWTLICTGVTFIALYLIFSPRIVPA
jgi:hypothetical protein